MEICGLDGSLPYFVNKVVRFSKTTSTILILRTQVFSVLHSMHHNAVGLRPSAFLRHPLYTSIPFSTSVPDSFSFIARVSQTCTWPSRHLIIITLHFDLAATKQYMPGHIYVSPVRRIFLPGCCRPTRIPKPLAHMMPQKCVGAGWNSMCVNGEASTPAMQRVCNLPVIQITPSKNCTAQDIDNL